jgi:hypothetical protein
LISRVAAGGRVFSLGSSPVPVTFVSFDGYISHDNSALISWSTSMEYNNKEFVVETSNDGIAFMQVAVVDGVGTTNNVSKYSIKVSNPSKYFRLKQIDFDGIYTYSKIIEISNNRLNDISIYPNPFIGKDLYISYNGYNIENVIVKIYDLNEKVHFETTVNFFDGNMLKTHIPEGLNKGIYFVAVISPTSVKNQKIVVE